MVVGAVPGTPPRAASIAVDAIDAAVWAMLGSLGMTPREAAVIADFLSAARTSRPRSTRPGSTPVRGRPCDGAVTSGSVEPAAAARPAAAEEQNSYHDYGHHSYHDRDDLEGPRPSSSAGTGHFQPPPSPGRCSGSAGSPNVDSRVGSIRSSSPGRRSCHGTVPRTVLGDRECHQTNEPSRPAESATPVIGMGSKDTFASRNSAVTSSSGAACGRRHAPTHPPGAHQPCDPVSARPAGSRRVRGRPRRSVARSTCLPAPRVGEAGPGPRPRNACPDQASHVCPSSLAAVLCRTPTRHRRRGQGEVPRGPS